MMAVARLGRPEAARRMRRMRRRVFAHDVHRWASGAPQRFGYGPIQLWPAIFAGARRRLLGYSGAVPPEQALPALHDYHAKRDFRATPEPPGEAGGGEPGGGEPGARWVIQLHAARRLHYDLRLEAGGVLVSWAVPKGPSYNPSVKRLAVHVEDHPLEYRHFEGTIPRGNYGAGAVIIWDEGSYRNLTMERGRPISVTEAVQKGHVSFWLQGKKLVGGWSLTRTGPDPATWALVKRADEMADRNRDITGEAPASVRTGRTVGEVREGGASSSPAAPARFLEPMLAQAEPLPAEPENATVLPADREGAWLFEPKLDGLRCLAVRNGQEVELWSRNQLSYSQRFPALVEAVRSLGAGNFVLDGEIVAMVDHRPDFAALQQGGSEEVEYWCFDLLWLLGTDLRHLAIEDRKSLLRQLLANGDHVKAVDALRGDPAELLAKACQDGWEGLVAKRSGSAYHGGRSADWRKLKCGGRQELVIGGFTEPRGTRSGFGALLLGYWEGGELRYAGKVGTGFSERTLQELSAKLAGLERLSSPFAGGAGEKGAHWVEPQLVADIAFSNWTKEGRLRHPRFLGLRTDKASRDVARELARLPVPLTRRRP
jgi:bifunctional non-homologous end joining protein LigD